MKDKINIAELLKDCPKGMKLYSTIYGTVYFEGVRDTGYATLIDVTSFDNTKVHFYPDGKFNTYYSDSEMTLFPSKDVRTWEGFQRPFKDGDILYTQDEYINYIFIFESITENIHVNSYLHIKDGYDLRISKVWLTNCDDKYLRFATEEEKQRLFQAIKDNGYKWNAETKTLEELFPYNIGTKVWVKSDKEHKYIHTIVGISHNSFGNLEYEVKEEKSGIIVHYPKDLLIPITTKEPKFKVGDKIKDTRNNSKGIILKLTDGDYECQFEYGNFLVSFKEQHYFELVPNKFDITTLKPFDKVLVRNNDKQKWTIDYFSFVDKEEIYSFICVGHYAGQCIPYEGNEHLLGTTNDCDEYFKIWE